MVEKENEQKQIELLQTIGHPDLDNIVLLCNLFASCLIWCKIKWLNETGLLYIVIILYSWRHLFCIYTGFRHNIDLIGVLVACMHVVTVITLHLCVCLSVRKNRMETNCVTLTVLHLIIFRYQLLN